MGKFIIKKVPGGFTFDLKAVNGEVIGTSFLYPSMESCVDGIEDIMNCTNHATVEDQTMDGYKRAVYPKFEIYYDDNRAFRFRLMRKAGVEVLASQAYTAKSSCQNGINSVIENAPKADVEEVE